jgi:3-oxoacyl-[acyl-carrier-protein] synthase II
MVAICGIGWITEKEYGCVMKDSRVSYQDRMALRKELFSCPFKGFGKLDDISAMLCYSVALALEDRGVEYNADRKNLTGIVGTNSSGCLKSDIQYFRDYIDSGRVMARGNLFIYTLPSSPLGEAAIHFGMQGPLLYIADATGSAGVPIRVASDFMSFDAVPAMMACYAEAEKAVCFMLAREPVPDGVICSAEEAITVAGESWSLSEMINRFAALNKERHLE